MAGKNIKIAFCGIDCSECGAYKATLRNDLAELAEVAEKWSLGKQKFTAKDVVCDGCQGPRTFSWARECPVRMCTVGKDIENCAHCREYPCENLQQSWSYNPDGGAANRARLDTIRETLV